MKTYIMKQNSRRERCDHYSLANRNVFKFIVCFFSLLLILSSCNIDPPSTTTDDPEDPVYIDYFATDENFTELIAELVEKPGYHMIYIESDILDFPGINIIKPDVNIILKGTGFNKITRKDNTGMQPLFGIYNGKFTLEDIILCNSPGSDSIHHMIYVKNSTLFINGTTDISNCINENSSNENDYGISILLDSYGKLIMTDGVIRNGKNGVVLVNSNTSFTMSGGFIKDNFYCGIFFMQECINSTLDISGGTIESNGNHGIEVFASNNNLNISGGNISGHAFYGVWIILDGNLLTMSGGTIAENGVNGVVLTGECNSFTMTGGNISLNEENGVVLAGDVNTFTMADGNISENGSTGITLWGNDCIVTINSGFISGNADGIGDGGDKNSITINGGSFKENNSGIIIWGEGGSLEITNGIFNDNEWVGVGVDGKDNNVIMSGGTINGNNDIGFYIGGGIDIIANNTVIISGGTISNCWTGVWLSGNSNVLTISGNTIISNNAHCGIFIIDKDNSVIIGNSMISDNEDGVLIEGNDHKLKMTGAANISKSNRNGVTVFGRGHLLDFEGGIIHENIENGIYIESDETDITISETTISDNKSIGILLAGNNNELTISENTSVINNYYNGIGMLDSGNLITINNGIISDNGHYGIIFDGEGNSLIISGGIISANGHAGLFMFRKNNEFEKLIGATIYGNNAGDKSNPDGAIIVGWEGGQISQYETAASTVYFAAKINASGDGLVPGSQEPTDWN